MPGPSANQGLSSTALPCIVQLGVCVPITPCHKNNIRDLFFIRRGLRECMTAGVCELNGVRDFTDYCSTFTVSVKPGELQQEQLSAVL